MIIDQCDSHLFLTSHEYECSLSDIGDFVSGIE